MNRSQAKNTRAVNFFDRDGFFGRLREIYPGTNQKEIAQNIGVKPSAITPYVKQGRIPSLATLEEIAAETEVSVHWLLTGNGPRYVPRETSDQKAESAAIYRPSTWRRYKDRGIKVAAESVPEFQPVPLLSSPIGAGPALTMETNDPEYVAFLPRALYGLVDPICVKVGPRELSMIPKIEPGDIVLLDLNPALFRNPKGEIYACNLDEGGTLKRVELRDGILVVSSDNTDKREYATRVLPGVEPSEILVGRVVWIGRYEIGH